MLRRLQLETDTLITLRASDEQEEEDWYPATQAEHVGLIYGIEGFERLSGYIS